MLKRFNVLIIDTLRNETFRNARRLSSSASSSQGSFDNYLKSKIKMKGPLTVAEYMKEALGNPIWVCICIVLFSVTKLHETIFRELNFVLKVSSH